MSKIYRELYGKPVAEKIEAGVRGRVESFAKKFRRSPSLGIILVGNDPASEVYVGNKVAACGRVGIACHVYRPSDVVDLEELLVNLNYSPAPDGVIMQLPLPLEMRQHTKRLFKKIDPRRDVDVLHPINVGLLAQEQHRYSPCTPHAVTAILQYYKIPIAGQHVVVVNRSDVVGKPLSSMLIHDNEEYANATVTVCHVRTPEQKLKEIASMADVLVVAVGIPNFVAADMVTPQTVLIDVGINRVGSKLVGDASPEAAAVVRHYTPVPGGVGPVTVASVLLNTICAAEFLEGLR
jgi:methylenetetrahydrofolate dehydrogenase (NADP+)/methenyltetrahydrofolate cyclohydrolase